VRKFDVTFKGKVVREYLAGKGGYKLLARKFGVAESMSRALAYAASFVIATPRRGFELAPRRLKEDRVRGRQPRQAAAKALRAHMAMPMERFRGAFRALCCAATLKAPPAPAFPTRSWRNISACPLTASPLSAVKQRAFQRVRP
jgi:transposase-like protein